MGGLGLLFIPTLGGYWLLTHLYYTRYGVLRDSGYHVLFKSAITGCLLVIVARLIIVFLLNPLFPGIGEAWKSYVPFSYGGTVGLSILLGGMLPLVINPFYKRERALRKVATESGNLVELLIRESIDSEKLIEISLKSRKSYIGVALESGSDVALIPVASGYRDESTYELHITTNYAPVFYEFLEGEESSLVDEDFRVVIPMPEIVAARIFDPEVYERFQQEESSA